MHDHRADGDLQGLEHLKGALHRRRLGALAGLALIGAGQADRKTALPFGTFLAVGALVSAVAGNEILAWYLAFYR